MLIRRNGGAGYVLLNQNKVNFEAKKIGFNVIILSQHLRPLCIKFLNWYIQAM